MTNRSEIESLVYLLDDPDPYVQDQVKSRFFELGEQAVPLLDEFHADIKDKEQKSKIGDIIHQITFEYLEADFIELLEKGVRNRAQLEDILFTLARFGNPTLNIREYKLKLDHLAEVVSPHIRYKLDERRKMKQLLKYVFEDLNFRGDTSDYHHPDNCLLDRVIDRRKGIPIALSVIVMFIGRRLELPFFGVNMPIHFMLNFVGDKEEVLIDPFDSGNSVTYDQCYFFLKKNGVEPKPEHFQIASDHDILIRCIRNLMHSYERMEQPDRITDLQSLLNTAELYGE